MTAETVLGIDLGIASVGWALIKRVDGESKELLGLGVRVFEEGVTNKGQGDKEESHATARRQKRLARRNLERRARRLNRVYNLLAKVGLLPALPEQLAHPRTKSGKESACERQQLVDATKKARHLALQTLELGKVDTTTGKRPAKTDKQCLVGKYWREDLPVERYLPYFLRDRAIRHALDLYELGRSLYSLAQRRGVWWNRADDNGATETATQNDSHDQKESPKKDAKSASENGKVKAAVAEQATKLKKFGAACSLDRDATLGEFYAALLTNDPKALEIDMSGVRPEEYQLRVRNRAKVYDRCTTREMVKDEFNLIWDMQLQHHAANPALLAVLNSTVVVPARKERVVMRSGKPFIKFKAREEKTVFLREALFKAIFHQRKLKNASHLIGPCELENPTKQRRECDSEKRELSRSNAPKHARKRAPAGHPFATRFRMLKMVNEVRVYHRKSEQEPYLPLSLDARIDTGILPENLRAKLVRLLRNQQSLSWDQARKELGLGADTAFNFELQTANKAQKGGNKKKERGTVAPAHKHFIGDVTASKMAGVFGIERWDSMCGNKRPSGMTEAEEAFWDWYACQDAEALSFIGAVRWNLQGMSVANRDGLSEAQVLVECARLREDAKRRRKDNPSNPGKSALQLSRERFGKIEFSGAAEAFGNLKLPKEYARYSTVALKRLLTDKTWGMDHGHPEGTARDMLYVATKTPISPDSTPRLAPLEVVFPTLNNPVVKRTLSQLRGVINDLITVKLGGTLPDIIRVEMTREMQTNREGREAIQLRQDMNKRANSNAAKLLGRDPVTTPGELKRKVQLAQEAGWHCPYCGGGYGRSDLDALEVEHIIPKSILPDDSFANLTLAHQGCNRAKGSRTPFQAREDFKKPDGTPLPWPSILQHVAAFRSAEKYCEATTEQKWDPLAHVPTQPSPPLDQERGKRKKKPAAAKAKEGEWLGRGHPKLRLFLMDDAALEEHKKRFTNADLTHTGYITKVALGYLATLYGLAPDKPHEIPSGRGKPVLQVSNGSVTALLRDELGILCRQCQTKQRDPNKGAVIDGWVSINHVLRDGGCREPGDGRNPLSAERRKSKREDHRHHAVDAAVVAIADPYTLLGRLAKAFANSDKKWRDKGRYSWGAVHEQVLPSWPNFYQDLHDFVHNKDQFGHGFQGVVVSHAVEFKPTGPLHDEKFRTRKFYTRTRDGAGFAFIDGKKMSVVEIGHGDNLRLAKPGENHHVAIYQDSDEQWLADRPASFFEVARRKVAKEGIIRTHHSSPGVAFRFALLKGNAVRLADGTIRIIRGFSAEEKPKGPYVRIKHVLHTDARLIQEMPEGEPPEDPVNTLFEKKQASKIRVSPIGEVRPVND